MPCTLLPSPRTFWLTVKKKKSGPQNRTHNEHLAPSMLWEMQHCKKQTKQTNKKIPPPPPQKKMEAKKAQTINKEVFATLRKLEKFFPKRWKTEPRITAQGHPWKRPPTHRYSVCSSRAPGGSQTVQDSNSVSLSECSCAKF